MTQGTQQCSDSNKKDSWLSSVNDNCQGERLRPATLRRTFKSNILRLHSRMTFIRATACSRRVLVFVVGFFLLVFFLPDPVSDVPSSLYKRRSDLHSAPHGRPIRAHFSSNGSRREDITRGECSGTPHRRDRCWMFQEVL